jgi:predicted permease
MTGSNGGGRERREDRRIEEEVRFHLEGRTEELMAAGLSREEAERRALAAFGDVDRVRSELRGIGDTVERRTRHREWLGGWFRDVRMGVRRLRRSPGYAMVSLLTLGLGIGASVAMFTVLNAVVLRPLPYAEPDRLVRLLPPANMNITVSRELGSSVASVASYTGISHWALTLTGEGSAAVVNAAVVDAGYFDVFGVRPALGRAFLPEETEPARSDVILISHGMWQTRFGSDPTVIGRRVRFSGYDHTDREIIGVMPEAHGTQGQDAEVWIPLHIPAGRAMTADSSWYVNALVARLVPGATVQQAAGEVRSVAARLRAEYPGRIREEIVREATATGLLDSVVGEVRGTLWLLLGGVGLVLLIACANTANLALARASGQRREFAVQVALGANRARLIRYQVAESGVVAVLGGVAGAVLARVLLAGVRVADSSGLPRSASLDADWRVFAFATAASVGALVLFGVLPAILSTRGVLRGALQENRGGSRSRQSHRLNRVLVAGELAMATLLTTAAALVLASFIALRSTDPGIDTSDVLAVSILPPSDRYSGDAHAAYIDEVAVRLAALPGTGDIGAIHLLPFTDNNWSFPYLAEGHAPPEDAPLPSANFRMITPGYLDAVDQPLHRGREFTSTDRAGTTRVLMINRRLAEMLWPGEDPVGRWINVFGSMRHEVVGVVGDVRQHALDREPLPEMYVPMQQWSRGGASVVFMVEGPGALDLAAEVRSAISAVDDNVPITDVRPLRDALDASVARQRFVMLVLAAFGGLALLLGGIGVHGVMSNLVCTRLGDFGIRLALGASPGTIQRQALATGLVPALAGLAIGTLASLAAAGLLRNLVGELPAMAPAMFAAVASVLMGVAVVSSWLPARRAAAADPLSALRAD